MRDFNTTRFTKRVAITEEDLAYINSVKGKKSAAGKLEEIIAEHKRPDLFKSTKKQKKK